MIEISELYVEVSRRSILHDVTCSFPNGVTALVGRNGAGKTSLLRAVCGLTSFSRGSIRLNGVDVHASSESRREFRRRLGWVPQHVDLPQRTKAGEFVRYCAWLGGVDGEATELATRAMQAVSLAEQSHRRIGQLSGGQQRRVMLASALVTDPTVLILDEPTTGLDPDQRDQFHDIVKSSAGGRTTLIATHLMEDVLGVADRVVSLDGGELVVEAPLAELLAKAQSDDPRNTMRQLRRLLYRRSE